MTSERASVHVGEDVALSVGEWIAGAGITLRVCLRFVNIGGCNLNLRGSAASFSCVVVISTKLFISSRARICSFLYAQDETRLRWGSVVVSPHFYYCCKLFQL